MATILVVDDEAPVATLLKQTLEQDGYTVLVAHSAQAAMLLARNQRPDLALIDLMLPLMDGRALCHTLHQQRETADLPVILMSASRPVDFDSCKAVAFLAKPFAINDVAQLVARHLSDGA